MRNRLLRGLMPALALAALAALPAVSSAGVFVGVSVNIAPPPLPVYVQPPCPQPGYLWVPGYWGWSDGAYYWVPGTWVLPPEAGLLWTPGYWGWDGGVYLWHAGYWGPHVGFYGGVNYGFGYDGVGFVGGYWRGRVFYYNRAVMRVGPRFAVYDRPVAYRRAYAHVSFNGGPGGVAARPTRAQMIAARGHHFGFTAVQQRQQRMAFADRSLRADYNHGRPPIAATARPAVFHGNGTFAARAAGGRVGMRSDRPSWATGQPHARPQRRFQSRPQAQYHQRFRPQQRERAPAMRGAARGQPPRGQPPRGQPRSGGRPHGGPPQGHRDDRGH